MSSKYRITSKTIENTFLTKFKRIHEYKRQCSVSIVKIPQLSIFAAY